MECPFSAPGIFLYAGPDEIGPNSLNEFLKFIASHIVVDQRAIFYIMASALIVVAVTEFVTGSYDFHPEVLIGGDDVTRTQSPDVEHHPFAGKALPVFVDYGPNEGLVFGYDLFGFFLDLRPEVFGNVAQRGIDLGVSKEIIFHPRDAIFFLHVPGDVIHRPIAVNEVECRSRRALHFGESCISGPVADHAQSDLLEQDA